MRYITSIERQAREEGVLLGMQQGMQQGEGALLYRLLTRRFGPLPAELAMRVQQASREQLMLWGDRVLDAASLEQVFAEPAH